MERSTGLDIASLLYPHPPKAAQFIVTIYGDVVEPRGGTVWMGNLIRVCEAFGLNESLVRTAVSRLVSRGQLTGTREGRRSFYELTPTARDEYTTAANLFFGSKDDECGWMITHCSGEQEQTTLKRGGFACLNGDVFLAPDRRHVNVPGTVFRSTMLEPGNVRANDLIYQKFDLDQLALSYEVFLERFEKLGSLVNMGLPGEQALQARLCLMHAYRQIRLRDPRLPPSVLTSDWPGSAARHMFATLYLGLSQQADAHIARIFEGEDGALPQETDAVVARLRSLKNSL